MVSHDVRKHEYIVIAKTVRKKNMICIVPSVYPTLSQAQHKNIGYILYIGNKYSKYGGY